MENQNNPNIELKDLINLSTSKVNLQENCVHNFVGFTDTVKKTPVAEQVEMINQCIAQVKELKEEQELEGGEYSIPTVGDMVMAAIVRKDLEVKLNQEQNLKYDNVLSKMENKLEEKQQNQNEEEIKQAINIKRSFDGF